MDSARRAFVQCFSCTRWYEASPFLQPMQTHARRPMLQRTFRERNASLEGAFPGHPSAPELPLGKAGFPRYTFLLRECPCFRSV